MSTFDEAKTFSAPPAPRRPANDDMAQGFMDGYDPTAPEPSSNRSNSYRHGFMVGRLDNAPADFGKYSYAELARMAEAAMEADLMPLPEPPK